MTTEPQDQRPDDAPDDGPATPEDARPAVEDSDADDPAKAADEPTG